MADAKTKQIILHGLRPEFHRAVKERAACEGKTMKAFILDTLLAKLGMKRAVK